MQVTDVTDGPGRSLSKESLAEAGVRLFDLNQKDAERKRTAELKNSLEEYIYSTKEKVFIRGCEIIFVFLFLYTFFTCFQISHCKRTHLVDYEFC
jgi:hypothetical protein